MSKKVPIPPADLTVSLTDDLPVDPAGIATTAEPSPGAWVRVRLVGAACAVVGGKMLYQGEVDTVRYAQFVAARPGLLELL